MTRTSGWRREALALGFRKAASGPFVRSSYHAEALFESEGPPVAGDVDRVDTGTSASHSERTERAGASRCAERGESRRESGT